MIINIHKFAQTIHNLPLEEMDKNINLIYDKTGFSLAGENLEETTFLNRRWSLVLNELNKHTGTEEYLTVLEVATHLKMSKQSVFNILKRQDHNLAVLPYIRTDRGIRIKRSDYLMFLSQHYRT